MLTFVEISSGANKTGSDQMLISCGVIWLHLTVDVIRGRRGSWRSSVMFAVRVMTLIKVGLIIDWFWVCTLTAHITGQKHYMAFNLSICNYWFCSTVWALLSLSYSWDCKRFPRLYRAYREYSANIPVLAAAIPELSPTLIRCFHRLWIIFLSDIQNAVIWCSTDFVFRVELPEDHQCEVGSHFSSTVVEKWELISHWWSLDCTMYGK